LAARHLPFLHKYNLFVNQGSHGRWAGAFEGVMPTYIGSNRIYVGAVNARDAFLKKAKASQKKKLVANW